MPTLHHHDDQVTLWCGDALDVARELPTGSVDCIVSSPPYFGLRDYGADGQYGLESSPTEYVERLRVLFAELRRVLADDGTLWLNIGDSYTEKNLLGIPWMLAFALREDGWILRNDIIWYKPNAMPQAVHDRLSARHEHVFLFVKQRRYWFDIDAIRRSPSEWALKAFEGRWQARSDWKRDAVRTDRVTVGMDRANGYNRKGANPGDMWEISSSTSSLDGAHFAIYPIELPQRCILAGCKPGGVVLDPFSGSGTTGLAAQRTGRRYIGVDINQEYLDLSLNTRLRNAALDFEADA
jgi:DNA modification methylase